MKKLLLILLLALPLYSQNASTLLNKVKQKYESLSAVCGEFKQTFHWKIADETQITTGTLCTRNGIMFRIEMQDQTIVSDGVTLWTLSKANTQVLIDNAANDKDNNPFLKSFIDKYFKQYKSELLADETLNDAPHYHLILSATSEDEFARTIELWVNKSTLIMSRIKQVDANGNDSIYEVTDIKLNPNLSDQDFKLTVPEGYETVDLR